MCDKKCSLVGFILGFAGVLNKLCGEKCVKKCDKCAGAVFQFPGSSDSGKILQAGFVVAVSCSMNPVLVHSSAVWVAARPVLGGGTYSIPPQ